MVPLLVEFLVDRAAAIAVLLMEPDDTGSARMDAGCAGDGRQIPRARRGGGSLEADSAGVGDGLVDRHSRRGGDEVAARVLVDKSAAERLGFIPD